jgi:hypothetical protein
LSALLSVATTTTTRNCLIGINIRISVRRRITKMKQEQPNATKHPNQRFNQVYGRYYYLKSRFPSTATSAVSSPRLPHHHQRPDALPLPPLSSTLPLDRHPLFHKVSCLPTFALTRYFS